MSKIKGPEAVGAGPAPVAEAGGERPVADAGFVQAAAEPAAVEAAGVEALFEKVAAELAAGHHADRAQAVRAAVDAVLEQELGHLDPVRREALAAQVSEALADHPDLSLRLDRLLEP